MGIAQATSTHMISFPSPAWKPLQTDRVFQPSIAPTQLLRKGTPFMNRLHIHLTTRLTDDETGATAVEYGLLVALIAAVIIAAVIILGGLVNGGFTGFNDDFTTATP